MTKTPVFALPCGLDVLGVLGAFDVPVAFHDVFDRLTIGKVSPLIVVDLSMIEDRYIVQDSSR